MAAANYIIKNSRHVPDKRGRIFVRYDLYKGDKPLFIGRLLENLEDTVECRIRPGDTCIEEGMSAPYTYERFKQMRRDVRAFDAGTYVSPYFDLLR